MTGDKGDYDDMFDFTEEMVVSYFEPVSKLIDLIEVKITIKE